MPRASLSRSVVAAAALAAAAIGFAAAGGARASACDASCGGYGSAPARHYDGPPVYAYARPVAAYAAPPVYAYSRFSAGHAGGRYADAYGPTYFAGYYTTRINIFRGPRWNYSAAYYTSPGGIHGASWRRSRIHRGCGPHPSCGRAYRAYVRGPIIRIWRRW